MGLDISVYKPVKATIETGEIEIFNIEDYPELAFFKEFIFEKENEYYNLQKELSKFGYSLDDLDWCGTEYGDQTIFNYINTKHELYEIYKILNEVWHKLYFSTEEELFQSSEFKKYIEYFSA